MALQITSTFKTASGIELTNAYARVSVINNMAGDKLDFFATIYATKEAFEAGAVALQPTALTLGGTAAYDYTTDGHDILDIAHDEMIQLLADQGVTAQKELA